MNRKADILRLGPALALVALTFTFFWNYFLLDETLYAGDTAFVLLPFHHFAIGALSQGELPLWNPFLFGGTPALAEAQYQVFYPPNALLFVADVARGSGWLLALHVLFLSLGTYAFAQRSLGLGKAGSLLAAMAFAFGGCIQSRLAVGVFTEAAAWLPWMLLWFDRARERGGASLLMPSLALAMQVLTGAPQYAFYSLALLLAYAVFRSLPSPQVLEGDQDHPKHLGRVWIALAVTPVVGALLAAAQLLPQWELARFSDRGTRATFDFATQFSLGPEHFVATATLPKFYGLFSSEPRGGFAPGEESWYIGALALPLALAALVGARRLNATRRRAAFFWAAVALLALGLALGRHNPLYHFLYEYVPGVAMFRAPARWLLVTSFCGAMLAGIGLDASLRDRRVALAALGCALALATATAIALLSPWGATAFSVAQDSGPWLQVGLLLAVSGLCAGLWKVNGTPRVRVVAAAALALAAADLLVLSNDMEVRHTLAVPAVEAPSPSAALIRAAGASGSPAASTSTRSSAWSERFWPDAAPVPMEPWQSVSGPVQTDTRDARTVRGQGAAAIRMLMTSCLPAEFGAPGLTGAWGALMPLRRHPRAIYQAETTPEERTRWLRMLNVRHHLSLRPLDTPGLSLLTTQPLYIYRDDAALPRAFWVGQAKDATIQTAESLVSAPSFDPRRVAIIEGAQGARASAGTASTSGPSSTSGAAFNVARMVAARNSMLELEVEAPRSGHLVVMDTPFPGWRATVDGRSAPILSANWVGRGIPVQAGSHKVRMWFEPQSVRVGVFISLLALAFAAGVAAPSMRVGKRHAAVDTAVDSSRAGVNG